MIPAGAVFEMEPKFVWVGFVLLLVLTVLFAIARRRGHRRAEMALFEPERLHELESFYKGILQREAAFGRGRDQDAIGRWTGSLQRKSAESGLTIAIGTGIFDVLTLGGSARKRILREEFGEIFAISEWTDLGFRRADENIRFCVDITGRRLKHGLGLLRRSQRLTHPMGFSPDRTIVPA